MIPAFLQKRRAESHSLRIALTLICIVVLLIGQAMAIATIIAERSYSASGKLGLIGTNLLLTLLLVGFLERTKR